MANVFKAMHVMTSFFHSLTSVCQFNLPLSNALCCEFSILHGK
jgi:hypothetical protein